jgi:hypothetical protein
LWRSLDLKPVWGLLEGGEHYDKKSSNVRAIAFGAGLRSIALFLSLTE